MSTKIGNRRRAEAALRAVREWESSDQWDHSLLGGFELLGRGVNRVVVADLGRRVVYKIDSLHRSVPDANNREHMRAVRARSNRPYGRYVAPTARFDIGDEVVLAQRLYEPAPEYYGDDDRLYETVGDAAYVLGLADIHDENWGLTRKGEPRIFDLVGWN